MAYSSVDLSDGLAEFNKSIRDGQPARHVAMTADRVYSQVRAIEKPEETDMRLKLLSPGEMNADQKQTYDESIAGKRGAPPPPMMAWLNSPEPWSVPAVRYVISSKTVGDRDPGHRTPLDLALRVVCPQAARAQKRHGSQHH
jgi:hypothetical protein